MGGENQGVVTLHSNYSIPFTHYNGRPKNKLAYCSYFLSVLALMHTK
jgi:hypothetical protein